MKIDKTKIYWSICWIKRWGNRNYIHPHLVAGCLKCRIISSGPKYTKFKKDTGKAFQVKTPEFFNICTNFGDPVYEV